MKMYAYNSLQYYVIFFFVKQKTAYEMPKSLEFRRVLFRSIFSFKQGARELDLTSGAVLLEVPPKAPAVKVSTSAEIGRASCREREEGSSPAECAGRQRYGIERPRSTTSSA